LAPVDQPVIIESEGADAYAAVMAATARLHEAVSRALGRGRRISRPRASVSGPRRTPVEKEQEEAASDARSSGLVITETDQERLRRLIQLSLSGRDRDAAEALAEELDRAEVVPAERIAGDVVTMNSRVAFQDEESGENREVSLVYPEDSDPARGRISVLAPVGTALLGLSVGQTIDWPLPRDRLRRYRVIAVVYQPEAAGDLHL
jgi:regulator of nucleoside diphosphate kinase